MPREDDFDDRRDDGYDDPPPRRADARRKAGSAGTALMLFGLLSLALAVLTVGLMLVSPDTVAKPYHEFMADLLKKQPNQPPNALPPYDEFKQQLVVQTLISSVIGLVASVVIALGGAKMRGTSGYALAVTGSVLALIPCTSSCCLLGFPIGLWALIVLMNRDVKAAFESGRRPPADEYDDRP